jgi:hypothetical protein
MADGDETEFDFLSNTKLLLGISNDTDDKILQFLISTVTQEILNFCNISKLPSALNFTLCEMVADVYRDNQKSNSNNSVVGNISTISEDGRSVSFTNGVELRTSIEDRIARTTELKRFKKLYRVD